MRHSQDIARDIAARARRAGFEEIAVQAETTADTMPDNEESRALLTRIADLLDAWAAAEGGRAP